jgi:hypothetical protein
MGLLALAFPILLWPLGAQFLGTSLQISMSAYYHTDLRDVFVGILVAIGTFLILYKGFSRREDWALNIAGISAIGIAIFPTSPNWSLQGPAKSIFGCKPLCDAVCMKYTEKLDRTFQFFIDNFWLHGICVGIFFVAIFFVCKVCSKETLETIECLTTRKLFERLYLIWGSLMLAIPAFIFVIGMFGPKLSTLFFDINIDHCKNPWTFFAEGAAVWSFSFFWLTKTFEIRINDADRKYPNRRAPKKKAAVNLVEGK